MKTNAMNMTNTKKIVPAIAMRADITVDFDVSVCGGSGGGRPDMAQAGGKQPKKVSEAIVAAKTFAQKAIR